MATNPDRDPVEVEADAVTEQVDVVKALKVGRMVNAEEWALRAGHGMAMKHLPDASFEEQDALATEIAETLTVSRRNVEMTYREALRTEAEKERRIGELEGLARCAAAIRRTFKASEDDGYRSRDRQFALDMFLPHRETLDELDKAAALTPDAGEDRPARADRCHPSHKTRDSDASSFDEICTVCGATDGLGTWGKLAEPCPGRPPLSTTGRGSE